MLPTRSPGDERRWLLPSVTVTYDPPHPDRQTATVRTLDAAGTGSTTTMTFEHNGRDLFLVAEGIQSVRQGTPLDKFTLADGSRVHTVGPGVRNAAWTLRGVGDRRVTNTVEVDALQDQVTLGDKSPVTALRAKTVQTFTGPGATQTSHGVGWGLPNGLAV